MISVLILTDRLNIFLGKYRRKRHWCNQGVDYQYIPLQMNISYERSDLYLMIINHKFISFSSGQIYYHLHPSPPTGILQTHKVTSSQVAQLVEHCTGIAEVMGSSPVQA